MAYVCKGCGKQATEDQVVNAAGRVKDLDALMAQYAIVRNGPDNPEVVIGVGPHQVRYEIDMLVTQRYVPIEIQAQFIAKFHAVRYCRPPYKMPVKRPRP